MMIYFTRKKKKKKAVPMLALVDKAKAIKINEKLNIDLPGRSPQEPNRPAACSVCQSTPIDGCGGG
jgi:hypothetical protein